MIDVSRQLKPAPLSFEKTISQHARARVHVELINDKPVARLNRKGRRKAEALARRAAR